MTARCLLSLPTDPGSNYACKKVASDLRLAFAFPRVLQFQLSFMIDSDDFAYVGQKR